MSPRADSPVLRIDPAYKDPEAVRALVLRQGPYVALPGLVGYASVYGAGSDVAPWFRAHWALDAVPLIEGVEEILHNPLIIEAARRASGAAVIRPQTLMVNLMGPQAAGGAHVDTPSFRGLARGSTPTWLLLVMGGSGLFQRWSVEIASAITWFYAGPEGDFEYWPEGPSRPSQLERAPFGNVAIVGDNDSMFHRVGAIGRREEYLPAGQLGPKAELSFLEDGAAEIFDAGEVRTRYAPGQVRISLLWKAHSFANAEAARLFDSHLDDLTPERVANIFCADLQRRGIPFEVPADPANDPAWAHTLTHTYPIPKLDLPQ